MNPNDFGPIYAETDLSRFPVEPWNTASNLIFLLIIIYFAWTTRLNFKKYPLIVFSLPILFVGFFGGTVFHATRSNRIWLMMDYLPIMILSLLASMALLKELLGSWIEAFGVGAILFIGVRVIFAYSALPIGFRISIGYTSLALIIILPAIFVSKKAEWLGISYILSAIIFFAGAITFRILDSAKILPMGTHFLWHIFGGVSVFCLIKFLFKLPTRS